MFIQIPLNRRVDLQVRINWRIHCYVGVRREEKSWSRGITGRCEGDIGTRAGVGTLVFNDKWRKA